MGRSAMSGGGGAGAGAGQGPLMAGGRRSNFFRTLGRAAAAGVGSGYASRTLGSSPSPSSPTRASKSSYPTDKSPRLSLSLDPASSLYGAPVNPFFPAYPLCDDDFVLVPEYDSSEDGGSFDFPDDSLLSAAPSPDEVLYAVSALKQASPVGSEVDWIEPSVHLSDSRMLQHSGYERVYDAFHLLQTDPCVQRMVISLSSDKEVWNAVLRNEVVQELKQALHAAEANGLPSSDHIPDNSNPSVDFVRWIFDGTKAKVRDVIEKIAKLVNQLFPVSKSEKTSENLIEDMSPFNRLVDTAYMLCVVVMLVVVVGRTIKYHHRS